MRGAGRTGRLGFAAALMTACLLDAAGGTILVVESYHAGFPWDISYSSSFEEALGGAYRFEHVYMDTKRLPEGRHQAMADAAWKRYQALKPDLVLLGDDAALQFLAPRLANAGTPVVYLGINNSPHAYYDMNKVRNMTGVLERPNVKRNIIIAGRLVKGARHALVLFDTDTTSQVVSEESFGRGDRITIGDLVVEIRKLRDWDAWRRTVLETKGRFDVLFLGTYHTLKDAKGGAIDPMEAIRWTSANTPIPLFGFWDFAVGREGAIGGLVVSGREQGRLAAALAKRILQGEAPASLWPVTAERGSLLFSRTQLRKHHLTLPPDLAQEASYVE